MTSPGIIDVSDNAIDDSDAQYSPISSYLRGLQSSPVLYHLDSDAEFEALTITNWIVDMLALRLPLDNDAVNDVLQHGLARIAVGGFIAGEGPWKHRLVFFYQSSTVKKMSLASKKAEHEAAVKKCKEDANVIFKMLDADGSGDIDRDELKVCVWVCAERGDLLSFIPCLLLCLIFRTPLAPDRVTNTKHTGGLSRHECRDDRSPYPRLRTRC